MECMWNRKKNHIKSLKKKMKTINIFFFNGKTRHLTQETTRTELAGGCVNTPETPGIVPFLW